MPPSPTARGFAISEREYNDPASLPRSALRELRSNVAYPTEACTPKLPLRALEFHGGRVADAEDAVSDVFLALVRKPPSPRTPGQLHHWLRSVLRNQRASRLRRLFVGTDNLEIVSLDTLQGWRGD
jgi:DNA-directed RNA polymerase specialized sigma24 family protein